MSIINICGILVGMLIDVAPDIYGLYVTTDRKGFLKIITQCMNVIYVTIIASLMHYCMFYKRLKLNEFNMNPYYHFFVNRLVNVLQQYILFHVGDFKFSHKDTKVNDTFIEVICEEKQSILEDGSSTMQVSRGKVHKYLSMTLEYSTFGRVKINMLDCIDEILYAFDKSYTPDGVNKSSAAPSVIFKVK